jgi:hypothetical protein
MNKQQIQLYTSEDGQVQLEIQFEQETLWLTQAQIADLFEVNPQNITMHLQNVYAEGELAEAATCKESLQVQVEGTRQVKRQRKTYNLDAVISVGYRVNSSRATQFRIWATATRELADLVQKNCLTKLPGGGRSTRYVLLSSAL